MEADTKSSFLKRTLSKEDAIIQVLGPQQRGKIQQAFDIFDRVVSDMETLTKLGTKFTVASIVFHVNPDDLKTNLDEFGEMENIANKGRAFLDSIGYISLRKNTPLVGVAPVGKVVDVVPIEMQLPGSEPLSGAIVSPKKK